MEKKKIKKEEDKEEYFGYPRPSNPQSSNVNDQKRSKNLLLLFLSKVTKKVGKIY